MLKSDSKNNDFELHFENNASILCYEINGLHYWIRTAIN